MTIRSCWRQVKANLLSRPFQSTLIVLTLTASAVLMTVGLSVVSATQQPFLQAFDASRGAHLWIMLHGDARTLGVAARKLRAVPGVEASTGIRQVAPAQIVIGSQQKPVVLEGLPAQPPRVAHPVMVAGRYFLPGTAEIILDKNLAGTYHIHPGDRVAALTPSGRTKLTVVGLAVTLERPPYSSPSDVALGFVPAGTLRHLGRPGRSSDAAVGLRLTDPEAVLPALNASEAAVGTAITGYSDWRDVRDTIASRERVNMIFLTAFGLVALVVSGLIMSVTLSAAILGQYRAIGLLKAIGFTRRQIKMLYLTQYAALGLCGGMLGSTLGILISPLALRPLADSLDAAPHATVYPALVGWVLASSVVVAVLSTVRPAWRAGNIPPAQAIRYGFKGDHSWPSRLARWASNLRLPVDWVVGLKDMFARRGRALSTACSVGFAAVAIVFALGLSATLDRFLSDASLFGVTYDASFFRKQIPDATAQKILASNTAVLAYYGDVGSQVRLAGTQTVVYGDFLAGNLGAFQWDITGGRMFRSRDEAVVSQDVLRIAGQSIGGTMRLVTVEGPLALKIVGTTSLSNGMGPGFLAGVDALRPLGPQPQLLTYYVKGRHGVSPAALVSSVQSETDDQLIGTVVDHTPPAEILSARPLMAGLSLVLTLIALLSVLNAALISVRERLRELAVLKAVGLTPRQVMNAVLVGSGGLALAASLVAVPIGLLLTYCAFTALAHLYNYTRPIPFIVNGAGLVAIPLAMLAVAVLGAALPARWAAQRKVDELIRFG